MSIHELIDVNNSLLIFIDQQPQMVFGVANIDRKRLKNNTVAFAKAGRVFNIPTLYTAIKTSYFSGDMWPELLAVHSDVVPIYRTAISVWQDQDFVKAVKATGRKKLVISALWTEACLTFSVLMALKEGFEVYVVTDLCAGSTPEAHGVAIERLMQAGAVVVTWQQVVLEYQADFAHGQTYDEVMKLIPDYSGACAMDVDYVYTVLHDMAERRTAKS